MINNNNNNNNNNITIPSQAMGFGETGEDVNVGCLKNKEVKYPMNMEDGFDEDTFSEFIALFKKGKVPPKVKRGVVNFVVAQGEGGGVLLTLLLLLLMLFCVFICSTPFHSPTHFSSSFSHHSIFHVILFIFSSLHLV